VSEQIRSLKGKRLDNNMDIIRRLYLEGWSCQEIASKYGVAHCTIGQRLRKTCITMRNPSEAKYALLARGWKPPPPPIHIGPDNRAWRGGTTYINGYRALYRPDHPRARYRNTGQYSGKYVYEHILVWEETRGKSLPDGWIVHHLNGIPTDNRPENLVGLPDKKHRHVLAEKAKRIRQLEGKVMVLKQALHDGQMIWLGDHDSCEQQYVSPLPRQGNGL
jgi:hypothetical protein